jgi:DnaJ like chaperone protein
MSEKPRDNALPARMEAEFSSLLSELTACGHQASELMVRTRLPGWCCPSLFFLSQRRRRKAIRQFQHGKNADHIPRTRALRLKLSRWFWPSPSLRVAICLCHAAQLFGRPDKQRRYRCEDAIDQMGLPMGISDDVLDSYASKVWITTPETQPGPTTYEQALQLLGVTRRDSRTDIKRAYRKRVSECHPDKLVQQNLSPAERSQAKDRLLKYQQAWELIDRRR